MTGTLAPMLGIIGLGGGEIILILLALMVPVLIAVLVISIVLFVLKKNNTGTPVRPSTVPPTRKRAPWVLLGCLVVGIGAILLAAVLQNKTSTADFIPPSKFLELVDSNRIVQATLTYSPQSPIYVITGTYKKSDSLNDTSLSRFTVKMPLGDKLLDRLESMPNVEVKEQHGVLIPIVLPVLVLALFVVAFVVAFVIVLVRFASSRRSAPRVPPVQPSLPVPPSPRKCPKCGSILKPDAPEGLCPACLLQHGIATEGGAPPGTPAFTPPPLLELAKLFPQLEILEIIGQAAWVRFTKRASRTWIVSWR